MPPLSRPGAAAYRPDLPRHSPPARPLPSAEARHSFAWKTGAAAAAFFPAAPQLRLPASTTLPSTPCTLSPAGRRGEPDAEHAGTRSPRGPHLRQDRRLGGCPRRPRGGGRLRAAGGAMAGGRAGMVPVPGGRGQRAPGRWCRARPADLALAPVTPGILAAAVLAAPAAGVRAAHACVQGITALPTRLDCWIDDHKTIN